MIKKPENGRKADGISSMQYNCLIGSYVFLFWPLFTCKAADGKQLPAFQGTLLQQRKLSIVLPVTQLQRIMKL